VTRFRSRLTTIGIAALTSSAFACATHAADNRRLVDELGRAERSASDHQRRIAELEWRLRELEGQRDAESRRGAARQLGAVLDRLDALLEQNRQLMEASVAATDEGSKSCTADGPSDGADAKVHLRFWAERLRSSSNGFRGGLTPEQNSALNLLLKRERLLDPRNPWPDL
jgi:hypothetical protein